MGDTRSSVNWLEDDRLVMIVAGVVTLGSAILIITVIFVHHLYRESRQRLNSMRIFMRRASQTRQGVRRQRANHAAERAKRKTSHVHDAELGTLPHGHHFGRIGFNSDISRYKNCYFTDVARIPSSLPLHYPLNTQQSQPLIQPQPAFSRISTHESFAHQYNARRSVNERQSDIDRFVVPCPRTTRAASDAPSPEIRRNQLWCNYLRSTGRIRTRPVNIWRAATSNYTAFAPGTYRTRMLPFSNPEDQSSMANPSVDTKIHSERGLL